VVEMIYDCDLNALGDDMCLPRIDFFRLVGGCCVLVWLRCHCKDTCLENISIRICTYARMHMQYTCSSLIHILKHMCTLHPVCVCVCVCRTTPTTL
jgi:hypothetical protein